MPRKRSDLRPKFIPASVDLSANNTASIPTPSFRRMSDEGVDSSPSSDNSDGSDSERSYEPVKQSGRNQGRRSHHTPQKSSSKRSPRQGSSSSKGSSRSSRQGSTGSHSSKKSRRGGKHSESPQSQQSQRQQQPNFGSESEDLHPPPHNLHRTPAHHQRRLPIMAANPDIAANQAAELARLQRENVQLLARAVPQQNLRRNQDPLVVTMKKNIYEALKMILWRTRKFLTSPAQEAGFAMQVVRNLGLEEYEGNTPEKIAARQVWVQVYSDLSVATLNRVRTYITGRLREGAFDYMDAHEGKLPNVGQLVAIATRQCTNPIMVGIFAEYLDKLLSKCTGNTSHWNEEKRYFTPVTTCIIEEAGPTQGKNYVPASTEAFCLVCLEGYRTAWQGQWEIKRREGPKANIVTPRGSKDKPLTEDELLMRGKFTEMDGGQMKYGGWTTEGLERFVEYMTMVKAARDEDRSATQEAEAMRAIRKTHKITATTYDDWRNSKRARRADYVPPQVVEVAGIFDEDE